MMSTGPLNRANASVPAPIQTTTPKQASTTPPPETPPTTPIQTPPPSSNVTQYGAAIFDPVGGLPPGLEAQDLLSTKQTATVDTLKGIESFLAEGADTQPSGEQIKQFDTLAKELGFKDFNMMKGQMRNLPATSRKTLFHSLQTAASQAHPSEGQTETQAIQAKMTGAVESYIKIKVDDLFTSEDLPAPQFESKGDSHWDAASLMASYNAIKEVKTLSPAKFRTIALSAGEKDGKPRPLTFVKENPDKEAILDDLKNNFSFGQVFDNAMYIAHASPQSGVVSFADTAVSHNTEDVTKYVAGKLGLISGDKVERKTGQLLPTFSTDEVKARGLDTPKAELETKLQDMEWLNQFGEIKPDGTHSGVKHLQDAINFVIKFRKLDHFPGIQKFYDNPITEDGKMGPQTTQALQAIRSYSSKGKKLLLEVAARTEQTHTVKQMQTYMRANTPFGSATDLADDGLIGKNTNKAVRQFQLALAMNSLKERIEDDALIPEPEKVKILKDFELSFTAIADNPDHFKSKLLPQLKLKVLELKQLAGMNPPRMSASTASALETDLNNMAKFADGKFDLETAEQMVGGWFDIMDSGKGDMGEQLISHEMSHLWQSAMDNKHLDILSNWSKLFETSFDESSFGTEQMNKQDYHDKLGNDKTAVSDYSSASAEEDFAEASRVFTYDPKRLMRRSLPKFLMMNSLHERPFPNEEVLAMAREGGYTDDQIEKGLQNIRGFGDIQFTTEMASRLSKDYEGLETLIHPPIASTHNFVSFDMALSSASHTFEGTDNSNTKGTQFGPSQAPPLMTAAAEGQKEFAPKTPPEKIGWTLEFLQHEYQGLIHKSAQPGLSDAQKEDIRVEMAHFEHNFIAQGFGDNAAIPTEAIDSLNRGVTSHGANTEKDKQHSRALLLNVAKMAVTHSSVSLENENKESVPYSFDLLMGETRFAESIASENGLSPDLLANDALGRARGLEVETDDSFKQLNKYHSKGQSSMFRRATSNLDGALQRYGIKGSATPSQLKDFFDFAYTRSDSSTIDTGQILDFMSQPTRFMKDTLSQQMAEQLEKLSHLSGDGKTSSGEQTGVDHLLKLTQTYQGYHEGPPPALPESSAIIEFLDKNANLSGSQLLDSFLSFINHP